jgi:hypothetical protein
VVGVVAFLMLTFHMQRMQDFHRCGESGGAATGRSSPSTSQRSCSVASPRRQSHQVLSSHHPNCVAKFSRSSAHQLPSERLSCSYYFTLKSSRSCISLPRLTHIVGLITHNSTVLAACGGECGFKTCRQCSHAGLAIAQSASIATSSCG